MPKITFYPNNITGEVEVETSILDAADKLGVELRHDCGGFATCSTCRVFVRDGMDRLSPVDLDEENMLEEAALPTPPYRLSCQTKLRDAKSDSDEVVVFIEEEMDWTKGAFRFLDEIPEPSRRLARRIVEKSAKDSGITAILPDFAFPALEEAKKRLATTDNNPEALAVLMKEIYS
ncbi:MAG: 2Fe-2S iron-sulfur cluster-binding protein [Nitrospirota bacterium]